MGKLSWRRPTEVSEREESLRWELVDKTISNERKCEILQELGIIVNGNIVPLTMFFIDRTLQDLHDVNVNTQGIIFDEDIKVFEERFFTTVKPLMDLKDTNCHIVKTFKEMYNNWHLRHQMEMLPPEDI